MLSLVSLSTAALLLAAAPVASTVHIRIIDAAASKTTPAMVCITGRPDGSVRLPPHGHVATQPSRVEQFMRGVRFDADPNWIGPIRRTVGKGDNQERSILYELRPSIPYWREPVMYQTSGDFRIELPAGRWRVAVEHGQEFVPLAEEFTLRGDERLVEKVLRLERWIDLPALGWWSGDVHVHHPILEEAHREYLMQYAVAEDLHVVNVLEMGDHQTTHFRQMGFGKAFRVQRGDRCLIAGQEDPRSTFGHIIGLNIKEMARDLETYDFYDLTFRRIHEQGETLVGFAHFELGGPGVARGFPWLVATGDLDFIELLQFGLLNATDYYDYLNLGFRLTAAAGSDVPWGSTIGEVRTFVNTASAEASATSQAAGITVEPVCPKLDVEAWFRGLKAGRTFVSNGPFLEFTVDGALPGSELHCAAGDSVKVHARVRSHPAIGRIKELTVTGNEGVLGTASGPGETERTIELERRIEASQWLAASAVCDNGAMAHTTPIYAVVNGRPWWCPRRGPAVIDRQLAAIGQVEPEFQGADLRSKGIRQRLEKAKAWYVTLRKQMQE